MTIEFEATMTKDQILEAEQKTQNWDMTKRCAMVSLTLDSKQQLENMDAKGAWELMEAVDSLSEYIEWRESETDLLHSVTARMIVVVKAFSDRYPTIRILKGPQVIDTPAEGLTEENSLYLNLSV